MERNVALGFSYVTERLYERIKAIVLILYRNNTALFPPIPFLHRNTSASDIESNSKNQLHRVRDLRSSSGKCRLHNHQSPPKALRDSLSDFHFGQLPPHSHNSSENRNRKARKVFLALKQPAFDSSSRLSFFQIGFGSSCLCRGEVVFVWEESGTVETEGFKGAGVAVVRPCSERRAMFGR